MVFNLRPVWDAALTGQKCFSPKTQGGVWLLPDLPWAMGCSPLGATPPFPP